jgi:PKD repeat protein
MKKMKFWNYASKFLTLSLVGSMLVFTSCKEEEVTPAGDPIATFTFEISSENYLSVTFNSAGAQNAASYAWSFGDDNVSTEANPTHVYSAEGTYTASLVVTNADGKESNTFTAEITITDPDAALKLLTGEVSKTWKLYREGVALEVGPSPENPSGWYAGSNDGDRPCNYDDSWTFGIDGSLVYDDGNTFWGEFGVWNSASDIFETCFEPTAENMTIDGTDVSAWGSGTHAFSYDVAAGELTLDGVGAWIVVPNLGTSAPHAITEFPTTKTVPISIEEFDGYDLLTVTFDHGDAGFRRATYVSYDDPADEPAIVSFSVGFDVVVEGRVCTFTNTSVDAISYSWDFGDGNSSAEVSPVHTYADDGTYTVVLTATGSGTNSGTAEKVLIIDTATPTEAAPTPTEADADVISVYSDAFTDITGVNFNPGWGQATVFSEEVIASDNVIKLSGLNYQGIDFVGNAQDVSGKTTVHVDIWCKEVTDVNFSLISTNTASENPVALTTEAGVWKSFDIPLTDYTVPDLSAIDQLKFDNAASATIYYDNIYFY